LVATGRIGLGANQSTSYIRVGWGSDFGTTILFLRKRLQAKNEIGQTRVGE